MGLLLLLLTVHTAEAECPSGNPSTSCDHGNVDCDSCFAGAWLKPESFPNPDDCCKCPAGKYQQNNNNRSGSSSCSTCAAGKSSTTGSGSCTNCAAGRYSGSGASSCTSCPSSSTTASTGSMSASQCLCNANYYKSGSTCTSCGIGGTSTPSSTSVSQCTCSANFYLGGSGCVSCGDNFITVSSGSTSASQCICNVGFFLDGSSCTICPNRFITASTGSTSISECSVCTTNLYDEGSKCACPTAGFALCWASASNGDDLELSAGTLSSWDGIDITTQLRLQSKYASIAYSADGGACVWQGATGKRVVYIADNGGTSTLSYITIKDGDASNGGGLYVSNSNVVLVLIDFIGNAASSAGGAIYVISGSSSVNLHCCSFSGNTAYASSYGPDVYNNAETVVIGGCPAGEDKSIRPSISFKTTNPPPPLPPSLPPSLPPPLLISQGTLKPKVPP